MTAEKVRRMLDACYLAKRIHDALPPLPEGVRPAYIRYLDVMQKLAAENGSVRVSDLSRALGLPLPGVTRTVRDMESRGLLTKTASDRDGRVVHLCVTQEGAALSERFDQQYLDSLARALRDIPEDDADCMIRTIKAFYDVMFVKED